MSKTTHTIEVPVFKAEIIYVENCSFASFMNDVRKRHPDFRAIEYGRPANIEYTPGTTGRVFVTTPPDKSETVFWFWAKEPEGQDSGDVGWIAHECYHLTCEILRLAEVHECAETEEVYAYTLEYITTEIVKKIWEREASHDTK